ncbi:MAG: multiheme c-type cytochrome, partial [bacterium]
MPFKNIAFTFGKLNLIFLMVIPFCPGILPVWAELSPETQECIACHRFTSSALYTQWSSSRHAEQDIGCYECHKAEQEDPDLFMHEGFGISIIVSPLDCAECHETQVEDYAGSLHAAAENILKQNPMANEIGYVLLGEPVARLSCMDCHGTAVQVVEGGKLDPNSWPNTGVGRLNPDGSRGACSACHQRHKFSKAQARRPRT